MGLDGCVVLLGDCCGAGGGVIGMPRGSRSRTLSSRLPVSSSGRRVKTFSFILVQLLGEYGTTIPRRRPRQGRRLLLFRCWLYLVSLARSRHYATITHPHPHISSRRIGIRASSLLPITSVPLLPTLLPSASPAPPRSPCPTHGSGRLPPGRLLRDGWPCRRLPEPEFRRAEFDFSFLLHSVKG